MNSDGHPEFQRKMIRSTMIIAILAAMFPTESRVRHWVDDQLQLMNLEQ